MICSTNQLTGFCMMATLRFNELNRFYKMKTDEQYLEALVGRCSIKKVFLEISQNSQENSCARDSFLIKFQALGLQLY